MYLSKNHSKFSIKYHIILSTKYRRKILRGKLKQDIKTIIINTSSRYDFKIDILESDEDHLHILVDSVPKLSPLTIVRILKQISTVDIWKLHPSKLKQYYWREKTLWADGYFVCSCGDASTETIKKYIESQG